MLSLRLWSGASPVQQNRSLEEDTVPDAPAAPRCHPAHQPCVQCHTSCGKGPCQCGRMEGASDFSFSEIWAKAVALLPSPCLQGALTISRAKIQSLYWESLLSSGLAFMLLIYFSPQRHKTLSIEMDVIFRKDKGSSKSGVTDSQTFRRI